MSRIGKKIINLPAGVEIKIVENQLTVKGPKGTLNLLLHKNVQVKQEPAGLVVSVINETEKKNRALWGLTGALVKNMIEGVFKGYERRLEMNGIGFKAEVKGKNLIVEAGFSHPVNFSLPEGLELIVEKNLITIKGVDKQLVGNVAAEIRHIRPPEPYKGSGIKYVEEKIRRKAGKAAVKASA